MKNNCIYLSPIGFIAFFIRMTAVKKTEYDKNFYCFRHKKGDTPGAVAL